MKPHHPFLIALLAASPAFAQETRHMEAHEHGVSRLDMAIEGTEIALELHAPGADIVGFEYEAKSEEDHAKIDAALARLEKPLDLFVMSAAAQCSVAEAHASLESEIDHEDHDHEDHDHDAEEVHEHAEGEGQEGHEEHTDKEEHAHEEHAGKEEHDHDHDHEEGHEGHTEFHAEYSLQCGNPQALSDITFAYFEAFPNALEVEVKLISESGAKGFEVERDEPVLDLTGEI